MSPFVVPIAVFAMFTLIVWIRTSSWTQTQRELNETVRHAIDKGQQLDPAVLKSLARPERGPDSDLRGGVILLSVAIGLALCGLLAGDFVGPQHANSRFHMEHFNGFYFTALIVGSLGIGRLIAAFLRRGRKDT